MRGLVFAGRSSSRIRRSARPDARVGREVDPGNEGIGHLRQRSAYVSRPQGHAASRRHGLGSDHRQGMSRAAWSRRSGRALRIGSKPRSAIASWYIITGGAACAPTAGPAGRKCATNSKPIVYGIGAHGGHAPYLKVPAGTLVALPDELSVRGRARRSPAVPEPSRRRAATH